MEIKKKVLLLTTSFGWGGTEGHVSDLARGYKKRGIAVKILVDQPPLDRSITLKKEEINVDLLNEGLSYSEKIYKKKLSEYLNKIRPDLVHINAWKRRTSIMEVLCQLKIPFAETLHCTIPYKGMFWLARNKLHINRNPIESWKYAHFLKKTQPLIINISDISLRNYQRFYPFVKKTIRIYCGAFYPEKSFAQNNYKQLNVLWIGSMIERKRPLLAIKIWKNIQKKFPDVILTMIGKGPQFNEVKKLANTTYNGKVLVLGAVPDLYPYLENSQIMLNTSTAEGIPKNLRYAMNFGIPSVTTNVGAIGEIMTDGKEGFLADINDVSKIQYNLELLLHNKDLRLKMGENAREQGKKLFDMENIITEIIKSYKEFLGIDLLPKSPTQKDGKPILD